MNAQAVHRETSELRRALRTLEQDQGPRARRNARARVAVALRNLRDDLDANYPAPPRKPARRRTPEQVKKALVREGWKIVTSTLVLSRIAVATIRVRRVGRMGHDIYAPGWAIDIASMAPEKLGRAKTSIRERRAILTELALKTQTRSPL